MKNSYLKRYLAYDKTNKNLFLFVQYYYEINVNSYCYYYFIGVDEG